MTKRIFICGLLSLGLCCSAFSQQNMTLYQMHGILQSNSLNPSVASDCKWNFGFPALGNISVAAGTPISYNELGAGKAAFDGQQIVSLMKNSNLVSTNTNVTLFTLGYRRNKSYFQFNVNERLSFAASFSKDPLEVLVVGNSKFAGKTIDGTLNLSGMHYREYTLSGAFEVGDNTWLGVRGRLLFGRLSALGNNSISVYTDPDTYALTFRSDLTTRMSIPGYVEINQGSKTAKAFNSEIEASHFTFNPSNVGGALDFGFNTSLENGWKISASIMNLGMISWTKNVHRFTLNRTKNYSGSNNIKGWNALIDTLKSVYKPYYEPLSPYSQWLFPTVMAGANRPVSEYLSLGLTGYGEFTPAGVPWALSATLLTRDIKHIHGALSYTVTNNSFVNVGLGLGLEFGGFNIHAVTDNIIALLNPASQKYAAVQFGINFKFGCGEEGNSSKKYRSIPCPSFSGAKTFKSVPCPK